MTQRDSKGPFTKRAQAKTSVPAIAIGSSAAPPQTAAPTFRSSWHLYAALIGFAIAWHFASLWIILAGIIVGPFVLLWWLERTGHHRAAYFLSTLIYAFVSGLFGGRGYYRRSSRRRW